MQMGKSVAIGITLGVFIAVMTIFAIYIHAYYY